MAGGGKVIGINSDTIRAGSQLVREVAKPNVFSVIVAVAALAFLGLLVLNDQKRSDAQITAMSAIVQELKDHSDKINDIHNWCCTVAPAQSARK